MITRLSGVLLARDLTEVVVDVHGVGFSLSVPVSTFERLPEAGEEVKLYTHLQLRDDGVALFGFATTSERQLFRSLIGVSGFGARIALSILSCMSVSDFCRNILVGDIRALSKINGIGKRSAERLLVEMKERVKEIEPEMLSGDVRRPGAFTQQAQDAIAALGALGFKNDVAVKAVQQVGADIPPDEQTAEALIRNSLRLLNS